LQIVLEGKFCITAGLPAHRSDKGITGLPILIVLLIDKLFSLWCMKSACYKANLAIKQLANRQTRVSVIN